MRLSGVTLLDSPEISPASEVRCRLCEGRTTRAFQMRLLGKHMVAFYSCDQCESLQSDVPHWLEEAYSPAVDSIDPGAAQRVLHCFALTHAVMRILRCRRTLDFGGGAGLLCRLLRDVGHDAWWYDQYSAPGYATGFVGSPREKFDLITSFEVVEHFSNPGRDIQDLFQAGPRAVLLMTELYEGQGADWNYIAPEEGQHIFFYSSKAMEWIARRQGYHLLVCRGFVLFLRDAPGALQRIILRTFLRHRIIAWIKLFLLARAGQGALRDYQILSARVDKPGN